VSRDLSRADPTSSQCTARCKSTGDRCLHRVRGGGVCHVHGGAAKQVKAAREARIIAMEAELAAGKREPAPPRHPGEVLLASVTSADGVMLQLQRDLERGELTPELARAYGEWVDRAGRLSKLALDAGIAERLVEIQERPTRMLVDQLVMVLRSVLADNRVAVERSQVSAIILDALRKLDGDTDAEPAELLALAQ
jgi:hypothetical protein